MTMPSDIKYNPFVIGIVQISASAHKPQCYVTYPVQPHTCIWAFATSTTQAPYLKGVSSPTYPQIWAMQFPFARARRWRRERVILIGRAFAANRTLFMARSSNRPVALRAAASTMTRT
jgi:hypothetical protein